MCNIPLDMCTKTDIQGYVMAMHSRVNQQAKIWESFQHKIVNVPLDVCTKTNIQGYVMAMYSPENSTSEEWKGIIET